MRPGYARAVVSRIWTLLLAVLLLAAPAGAAFAEVDAHSEAAACDELVVLVAIPLPAATPARVPIVDREVPLPSAPSLARVFRPPDTVVR